MDITYDIAGTLRAQDHGHPPLIFDARGNGGGGICPTITGDHQNRITDYTAIVCMTQSEDTDTPSLETSAAPSNPSGEQGGGNVPLVIYETVQPSKTRQMGGE